MDFEEVFMNSIKVTERGIGAFIGEASLLFSEPRGASVVAHTEVVQSIALTKEAFEACAVNEQGMFDHFRKEADVRKAENLNKVGGKGSSSQLKVRDLADEDKRRDFRTDSKQSKASIMLNEKLSFTTRKDA